MRILAPILLAIFFGWYTFSKLPIGQLVPYFKNADYGWIALGVTCGLLSHLSRAYRWRFQLRPLHYDISFPNSAMAVFVAYLANFGIPRSGEVLRAAVLANYEEVPFEKAFGTIVAERVIDALVLLMIIGITLILQYDFISEALQSALDLQKLIFMAIAGGLALVAIIWYLSHSKSKLAARAKTFFKGLLDGVRAIYMMEYKWPYLLHTAFIWAMYVLMFYVTVFAVEDLSNVSLGAILVAFIAGSFAIVATNGGIFVYPWAISTALSLFGVEEASGLAFGWISWVSQTLMIIVFGTLSFILLPVFNRKK